MSNVIDWAKAHPRLSAWMLLAVGMVAIITYEARDVGLLWGQWAALIIATIAVAALCVWIINRSRRIRITFSPLGNPARGAFV